MKFICFICVVAVAGTVAQAGDFAIRDGDTVVFLGDSITAEGTYGKIVENYTLLRYPQRKVHFINAGWGGDTAAGGLKRLQRDVFDQHATLLTVAYGINDIGWGGKADDEHRKLYLDSIRQIVQQCKDHKVRVFICSAAVTGADPDKSENDFLQKMCDEGMEISRSLGEGAIDVQRTMRQIQKRIKEANAKEKDPKKHETLHAPDTIHLTELGETAMAFAIIKGLGAPAEVSWATIDASDGKAEATGCVIDHVAHAADSIEFDRRDEGLPLNFGLFGAFRFRFIPIPDQLNRYMLTVKNLKGGKYEIKVDGRGVGTFESKDLERGVNLSSATADGWAPGGPWEAQAWLLNNLTNGRFDAINNGKFYDEFLKSNPEAPNIKQATGELNASVEALQRSIAKPAKYHFVIRPAATEKK